MAQGFLFLVAIMVWQTREVLWWRLSNTLAVDFCVEALDEALQRFWPPEIVNYEVVYLRAYETVADARFALKRFFYITTPANQALGEQTPDEIYVQTSGLREAA